MFIPSLAELVKLSQCGGTDTDLQRMENLIGEKLQWKLDAITPLTFLQYFYEMFLLKEEEVADPSELNSLIAKLQVLMCQYRFSYYRVSCHTRLFNISRRLQVLDVKIIYCLMKGSPWKCN